MCTSPKTLKITFNVIFISCLPLLLPLFNSYMGQPTVGEIRSTMSASSQAVRYSMVSTKDDEVDAEAAAIDTDDGAIRDTPRPIFWAILDR